MLFTLFTIDGIPALYYNKNLFMNLFIPKHSPPHIFKYGKRK